MLLEVLRLADRIISRYWHPKVKRDRMIPDLALHYLEAAYLYPKNGEITKSFLMKANIFHYFLASPIAFPLCMMIFGNPDDERIKGVTVWIIVAIITALVIPLLHLAAIRSYVLSLKTLQNTIKHSEDHDMVTRLQWYSAKIGPYFVFLGASLIVTAVLFTESRCYKQYSKNDGICGFLYPTYLPVYNLILSRVVLFTQILVGTLQFSNIIQLFLLLASIWLHLGVAVKEVRDILESIKSQSEDSDVEIKQQIREFFIRLQQIKMCARTIDEKMGPVFFVVVSSFGIQVGLGMVITIMFKSSAIALTTIVWSIGEFCLDMLAQFIINECERLCEMVYDMPWYDMNLAIRKDMPLMLLATSQPIYMHAGFLPHFSANKFLTLCRVMYSWIMMFIDLFQR